MSPVQSDFALAPACDPLLASVPLPYRQEFYPYGFPTLIASNSPAVLEAAQESWAEFRKRFNERPLEIRVLVAESATRQCPPPPVVRAQRNLLVWVADAENFSCCDLTKGFGFAWVTESVAAQAEYLRYHFLEAMAYSLLDTLHVVAVHAACVALDGHGVLLAGESGAGKSSLAYACARRGWTYISDDASSLVRRGEGRTVLGDPGLFRFRGTAGELFPEFRGMKESRRANGKPTIEVRTDSLPAIRTASESRVDYIVFLNRRDGGSGHVQLLPVAAEEGLNRLFSTPWPAELPTGREQRAAVERLMGAEIYEMRYREMDAAVGRLQQLVLGESQ